MAQTAGVAGPFNPTKKMTEGELTLVVAGVIVFFLSVLIAAKTFSPGFAFHASLFAAASAATVLAVFNRYYTRPAQLPPAEIDGKPNYNYDPIKFGTIMAMVWGVAGFLVGLIIALQLAFPSVNFDLRGSASGVFVRCIRPR